MNTISIFESGMEFGPYPEESCFYIEKSKTYTSIQNRVKIAEFLWINGANIWVVEAKSSSPHPHNLEGFKAFLADIRQKMQNALLLFIAMRLGRYGDGVMELPQYLRDTDLAATKFTFVLVIRNHPKEWLSQVQIAMDAELYACARAFGVEPPFVAVINEEIARRKDLMAPRPPAS